MKTLNIYTSVTVVSAMAAAIWLNKYSKSAYNEVKDLNAITTGDISTWIGTLSQEYDKIFVNAESMVAAATGKLTTTQLGLLWAKLNTTAQGTQIGTNVVNATTHTTTTIGHTGESWTVNELVGKWVYIYGGTGIGQLAKIKSNTATVITVENVGFATDPIADSDFRVLDSDMGLYLTGNTETSVGATQLAWNAAYPNNVHTPIVPFALGGTQWAIKAATADSVANGTLTDSGNFAGVDLTGKYVYIVSATTGANQYRQIASNTDDVLTLTANWGTNPATNIVYRVMADTTELFHQQYYEYYLKAYMLDPALGAVMAKYKKIIDWNQTLASQPSQAPTPDYGFLQTMRDGGKAMYDYTYPIIE